MAEPTLLPERLQYRPTKIELDESIEKAKATLLKKIKRSVYVYRVDCGGCNGCEIEIFGSITPVFDVERFGIKVVPSPRHADVLLYTGAVTRAMRMPALRAFEAAPDPKIVVSYGACGCTGGIFYDNYCVWGGTDKILPVDVLRNPGLASSAISHTRRLAASSPSSLHISTITLSVMPCARQKSAMVVISRSMASKSRFSIDP